MLKNRMWLGTVNTPEMSKITFKSLNLPQTSNPINMGLNVK